MTLNIGSHELPLNAATKTFAVLAKRGAGKTYTGAVMAEEFFKQGIPFVVFDPIDVWWGLRLAKDGKSPGLPIVVFGVEHADVVLEKEMGKQIAQAIVKHNASCVISTFGLPKKSQKHLISEFSDELLRINNTPRHVFIEEAHEFVPQRVLGDMGKVFNSVSNLVVMGRNRGIGVSLINQRAATINKDVLTQVDTLLAFRNIAPQDRKALREWVEHHAAEGDFEMFMKSLPSLPTGEGWMWSPEFLGIFERIKIRERETFHPDREKLGDTFQMPVLNRLDIQDFIQEFKGTTELPDPEVAESITPRAPAEATRQEIARIRNEYESQLMQKDGEIRRLSEIIAGVQRIVSVSGNPNLPPTQSHESSAGVNLWLSKLGTSMPATILKFLSDKKGLKFTRSQAALATGYSSKSGSFRAALSLLRRNNLIKEEGGLIMVHPDL